MKNCQDAKHDIVRNTVGLPYHGGGRRLNVPELSGTGLDGRAVRPVRGSGCGGGVDNRGDSFDGDKLNGGAIVDPFTLHFLSVKLLKGAKNAQSPCIWRRWSGSRFRRNLEEPCLNEEVPHTARLVDVDLDKVSRLSSTQFSAPSGVFANQCFLDDQIWLR
jgi:hypothetical protein